MIDAALNTITSGLKAALAGTVDDVEDHPGRFDEQEIRRYLSRNSAVRVAIEDVQRIDVRGDAVGVITLTAAAYVIAGHPDTHQRQQDALQAVSAVLETLPHHKFSDDCVPVAPDTISAQNLYSGQLDARNGIALWGISWQQRIKVK